MEMVSEHRRVGAGSGARVSFPRANIDGNCQSSAVVNPIFSADILRKVMDSVSIGSLNADGLRGEDEPAEAVPSVGTPNSVTRQES